jgi:hypothetical protein
MILSRCPAALLAVCCLASPAAAQLELTPYLGAFLPAGRVVDETHNTTHDCFLFYFNRFGDCSQFSTVKHKIAPLGGARLTAWIGPRLALGVAGSYTASGTSSPSSSFGDASARVAYASGRVVYLLTPHRTRTSFYALLGPAVVWQRGRTYDSVKVIREAYGLQTKTRYWGAVLGVGLRRHANGPTGWVVELEDNHYGLPGIRTPQKQNDLVLSLGFREDLVHSRTRLPSP